MASLLPGFEYDIFISYRQKDNKRDRWVSEFVNALKSELEATFKEDITIYFDENPHDGLLETHDVDASLKEKLKCLIFIPIISRTYCDPKSFAWEHEFKAFIEQASNDQYGLKIKLPNGNVASRVLPVRIYDLDVADIKICESVLGGAIRGVDFVFKEPGVNRPLTTEDDEMTNQAGTKYRNQINKTANAIKEIIEGLRPERVEISGTKTLLREPWEGVKTDGRRNIPVTAKIHGQKSTKRLIILFTLTLCLIGAFAIYKFVTLVHAPKTIAVIPYTNPPDDPKLAFFSVGAMDAIISKLQEIKSLTVRSRVSSQQYLDTKEPLSKIRDELKINYLIDIRTKSTKDSLKMWVGLTKTNKNKLLWAKEYNIDEKRLMPLFKEIVQIIAKELDVVFSPEEINNIEHDLTKSSDAYVNYLSGNARLFIAMGNIFVDSASFKSAIQMYDKAIEYDPDFAIAYARRALARSWGFYTGQLNATHIEKCLSDIRNAERINKGLLDVQIAYGFYYYYCKRDYSNALLRFHDASIMDPENYQPLFYMALVCRRMGDWENSQRLMNRVIKFNPQEALYLTNIGLSYAYLHNFDSALIYHQKAIDINPDWSAPYVNKIQVLILKYGNTSEAHAVLNSAIKNTHERLRENKIILDIYDGKYTDALNEIAKSDSIDFPSESDRYMYLANIYNLLNKSEIAEHYYDSAIVVLNIELSGDSTSSLIHSYLGIANAGKGNADKAISEGEKAIELSVENKNKVDECDMLVNLALIYTRLGRYNDAISNVIISLKNPSLLSVKLLQIDPDWKPLLSRPEFSTILKEYSKN